MLNVLDVVIDADKTVGHKLLLTNIRPYYEYNGAEKSDKVIGHKYEIVLPERRYEKISVKIEGHQRLDMAEDSDCIPIILDDLCIKIYWMAGNYKLSATASNIRVPPKKE